MTKVTPRARRSEDRAGDPLDGLVNLFDLGIVLSVAFLLAALSSLKLSGVIGKNGLVPQDPSAVPISPGQILRQLPTPGPTVNGSGVPVGTVYRLPDGRLVYAASTPTPPAP